MFEISRRGLFACAAAGLVASTGLSEPQSSAATALPASQKRKFSMSLGVHMTNWQVLLRKNVMTWQDIGRVSAELGFHGIELQGDNVQNVD